MVLGPKEDRLLMTGLHTVADIQCTICQQTVGWRYVRAIPAGQRTAFVPPSPLALFDEKHRYPAAAAVTVLQLEAFEESQKYKEGKVILCVAAAC